MYVSYLLSKALLRTTWKCSIPPKKSLKVFMVEYELGVIREGKVMLMMQIDDMNKMQEVISSDEMKAWDDKFNCVDEVYALDQMN